jgi:hypothetical protein
MSRIYKYRRRFSCWWVSKGTKRGKPIVFKEDVFQKLFWEKKIVKITSPIDEISPQVTI